MINTLYIAICDDEEIFSEYLKNFLKKILINYSANLIYTIDIFNSATSLLDHYDSKYSICFLDIYLNDEDGIATGIELKKKFPDTFLIFVTSFINYSLDGYRANAYRYLLKDSLESTLPDCINEVLKKLLVYNTPLNIKTNGEEYQLNKKKITYIESIRHNQFIHLTNNIIIKCTLTLNELETQATPPLFLKPHKSFIVNIDYIERISKYELILSTGTHIPIARNKLSSFKKDLLHALSML